MHSENRDSAENQTTDTATECQGTDPLVSGSETREECPEIPQPLFLNEPQVPNEMEPTSSEALAQSVKIPALEATTHEIAIDGQGENQPYFSFDKGNESSPQTSHLSRTTSPNQGSIQVLVIFLLGSFAVCSTMLNLYLFWQARNLGAEVERLKPPTKSGLSPKH